MIPKIVLGDSASSSSIALCRKNAEQARPSALGQIARGRFGKEGPEPAHRLLGTVLGLLGDARQVERSQVRRRTAGDCREGSRIEVIEMRVRDEHQVDVGQLRRGQGAVDEPQRSDGANAGIDANATTAGNQSFTLLSGGAFTAAGQLSVSFETRDGNDVTVIRGNVNANADADFELEIEGHHELNNQNLNL